MLAVNNEEVLQSILSKSDGVREDEYKGTVIEVLPAFIFKIRLENNMLVLEKPKTQYLSIHFMIK